VKAAKRLNHCDWLNFGLDTINTGADLTIDGLCRTAGKTKGSFYHHFKNHNEFVSAMMQHWEKTSTAAVIKESLEITGSNGTSGPALRRVIDRVLDHKLEVALRRFAAGNTIAAEIMGRVDETRLFHLIGLISALPDQTRQSAEWLARIEYAMFVGCQVLWPEKEPETLFNSDGTLKT